VDGWDNGKSNLGNIEHRTPNFEHRMGEGTGALVGCATNGWNIGLRGSASPTFFEV
jgi:hypothetical protein